MRRFLVSALVVALAALPGERAMSALPQSTLAIVIGYDLDSTTVVYPIALGPSVPPATYPRPQAAEGWFTPVPAPSGAATDRRIKTATAGTAAAVSCVTSGSAFDPVGVGDILQFNDAFNHPLLAGVFAKADANRVTLDRAVDLTQTGCASYRYRRLTAGAGAADGWFSVAGYEYTTIYIDFTQMVVTGGIDYQVECQPKDALSPAKVLVLANQAAAGVVAVAVPEPWDMCRVGLLVHTSDSDATPATDNEKISIFAIRR